MENPLLQNLSEPQQENKGWYFCYWDEPKWITKENHEHNRKEQQTSSDSSLPSIGESQDV